MADNKPAAGTGGTPQQQQRRSGQSDTPVETKVGRSPSLSVELGMEAPAEGGRRPVQRSGGEGVTADFGEGTVRVHESDKAPRETKHEKKPGEEAEGIVEEQDDVVEAEGDEGEKPEGEEKPAGEEGEAEPLPEFDASKPDVVKQYDAKYVDKDGGMNVNAFSENWWKGAKRSENGQWEGSLSEGEYNYLATKGYPKAVVKDIEAGLIALQEKKETALYQRAGGPDKLQEALDWARGGGYNPKQKATYMEAISANDIETAGEAVDLLMVRYQKANPGAKPKTGPTTAVRPARTTAAAGGGEGGGGSVQPFQNYQEYSAAVREARAENNQAKYNTARARLRASPWSGLGKK